MERVKDFMDKVASKLGCRGRMALKMFTPLKALGMKPTILNSILQGREATYCLGKNN